MTYFKSILAGFLALVLTALITVVVAFILHGRILSASGLQGMPSQAIIVIFRGGSVGAVLQAYELWMWATLIFALGFDLEFRRLSE